MDPIEILMNEHGLIRSYLDNLNKAVVKLENGEKPPRAFFEKAVAFSREFADKFHHFKEEHLMFVRLAAKKRGAVDAQIDALRYQHERGRELVTQIEGSLSGYGEGDSHKTSVLIESAAAYISLLRQHIHTEDHVFYPMARKELSDQEFDTLLVEFEREKREWGGDTFERHHKFVVEMSSMLSHMK